MICSVGPVGYVVGGSSSSCVDDVLLGDVPFEGVVFEDVPFEGVDVEGVVFEDVPFEGVDVEGVVFEDVALGVVVDACAEEEDDDLEDWLKFP